MFRFAFRLVLWVTVARWMYAEAALLVPSSVPYIEAALQKIQIPTHDKWRDSELGRQLVSALPSGSELRSHLIARVDQPLRTSAATFQQVGYALSGRQAPHFDEF
ncbi:MAG: hypothetical protein EBZ48_00170 [Proteobacteria bacterium]|nr:hypothetical protein [Pseudomonadota bacterium]